MEQTIKYNSKITESKIFLISIIQVIAIIISIYFAIIVFNDVDALNAPLDRDDPNLTALDQSYRAITFGSFLIYFYSAIYIFTKSYSSQYKILKFINIFTLSLIPPLTFIIVLYYIIVNKLYKDYFLYMNRRNDNIYLINNKEFWKIIIYRRKLNKSFFITLFSYIVFLITLVGIFLMFYKPITYGEYDPYSVYTFSVFSFFTKLTNILVFIYISIFLLFKDRIIFRKNVILVLTASYIFVVSTIYWWIILPGIFLLDDNSLAQPYQIVETVWHHLIVPVFFIIFALIIFKYTKFTPSYFSTIVLKGMIYPAGYSSYVFILPFFARYSVYSFLTNTNPNMVIYGTNMRGNYLASLSFILISLYFILIFFIFWSLSIKLSNNRIRYLLVNKK